MDELEQLKKTYDERYGIKPSSDYESIRKLHSIYPRVMDTPTMTKEEADGIAYYYRILEKNNLPAYYWILDAIHVTARKIQAKKKFNYLIGTIKNWMKYGYGHAPSDELFEIIDYFEEIAEDVVPDDLRQMLTEMMAHYGAIQVTRMIGSLRTINKSRLYVLGLKDLLSRNYEPRPKQDYSNLLKQPQEPLAIQPEIEKKEEGHSTPADKTKVKNKSDEQVLQEAELVELFLKEKKSARIKDVKQHLLDLGVERLNNFDWVLMRYAKLVPNIIRDPDRYGHLTLQRFK